MRRTVGVVLSILLLFTSIPAMAEDPAPVPASLRDTVARVAPSVVSISVVKREPSDEQGAPPRLIGSSGSGFVIHGGQYILSNAHVLDHAVAARITTWNGSVHTLDPEAIWSDPVSDIAVARLKVTLPPVTWADGKDVRLGDSVFAVGAPYGLRFGGSVSRGIISGFERELGADYTFLQTDAPINPGNSGGPLFNADGQVVGVNARGIMGADGMGFAIPASLAMEIGEQLIRDGKVERAWLGLRFAEGAGAPLGWWEADSPMVTMVEPGGAAEKTGIQVGDMMVALNGKPVSTMQEIGSFLRTVKPGTPATVTYRRGTRDTQVSVTLTPRPHDGELYHRAAGLWVGLSGAQQEQANRYGREWSFLSEDEMADPWKSYHQDTKAVLVTEYLSLAMAARTAALNNGRLTTEQLEAEAKRAKGILEVWVDLPTRWPVGAGSDLWAEWTDEGGTVRALSVSVREAPAGYRRLVVQVPSQYVARTGYAVVEVHLGQGTSRRVVFDLDAIH